MHNKYQVEKSMYFNEMYENCMKTANKHVFTLRFREPGDPKRRCMFGSCVNYCEDFSNDFKKFLK